MFYILIILIIIFVIIFAIYKNYVKFGGNDFEYVTPIQITTQSVENMLNNFSHQSAGRIILKEKILTHIYRKVDDTKSDDLTNYINNLPYTSNEYEIMQKYIVNEKYENYTIYGAPSIKDFIQENYNFELEDKTEIIKKLYGVLLNRDNITDLDLANPFYGEFEINTDVYKTPHIALKYIFTIFKDGKKVEIYSQEEIDVLNYLNTYINTRLYREKFGWNLDNRFYSYVNLNSYKIYAIAVPLFGQVEYNSFTKNVVQLTEFIYRLKILSNINQNMKEEYKKQTFPYMTRNQKDLASKTNINILQNGEVKKVITIINKYHGRKTVILSIGEDFYQMDLIVNNDYSRTDNKSRMDEKQVNSPNVEYYGLLGEDFPYAIVKLKKITNDDKLILQYILPYTYRTIKINTLHDFNCKSPIPEALMDMVTVSGRGEGESFDTLDAEKVYDDGIYCAMKVIPKMERYGDAQEDFDMSVITERFVIWIVKKSHFDEIRQGAKTINDPTLLYTTDSKIVCKIMDNIIPKDALVYCRLFPGIKTNNLHFKVEIYKNSKYYQFAQLLFTVSIFAENNNIVYYDNYKKITSIYPEYYKELICSYFIHYGLRQNYLDKIYVKEKAYNKSNLFNKNNKIINRYNYSNTKIMGRGDNLFDNITWTQFKEIEQFLNLRYSFSIIKQQAKVNKQIDEDLIKRSKIKKQHVELIYNAFKNSAEQIELFVLITKNIFNGINGPVLSIGNEFALTVFPESDIYFIPYLIDIKKAEDYEKYIRERAKGKVFGNLTDKIENYRIIIKKYDSIIFIYKPSSDISQYNFNSHGPLLSNIFIDLILENIQISLGNVNKNFILITTILYPNSYICKIINYISKFFEKTIYEINDDSLFIKFMNINKSYKRFDGKVTYDNNDIFFEGHPKLDLPIPVDIDIDESPINNNIKAIHDSYYNNFIVTYNNLEFENKEEVLENLIYERLNKTREYYEKYDMKFDNYFTANLTNYNKIVYQQFLSFKQTVFSSLATYGKKSSIMSKPLKGKEYDYAEFMKYNKLIYANKQLLNASFPDTKEKYKMYKNISEDFTRGVAIYISNHYKLNINRISNAFVKLWEIYIMFPVITGDINAFHMCEAPGQWIKTTEYFMSTIMKNNNFKYNWLANSLNPSNPENIKKFGDDIINDTYGLLKNNKNRWLFAEDDTGDITISKNIRWYRENVKANLVTGDAGLSTDLPLVYMQKLDYSQYLITAAVADKGANCVIKCFQQFIVKHKSSMYSDGFFVNLLYLYFLSFETVYIYKPYTSGAINGEFYIVGINFLGVSKEELEDLLTIQDNFEENMTFFERKDIPDYFVAQVESFVRDMTERRVNAQNKAKFLINVVDDTEDKYGFKDLLANIKEIHEVRFKEWIRLFKFV